jgi:hypothetical protein
MERVMRFPTSSILRHAAIAACVAVVSGLAMLVLTAGASAHPIGSSGVNLSIGTTDVRGELLLPTDALLQASGIDATNGKLSASERDALETYLRSHMWATGRHGGRRWKLEVSKFDVRQRANGREVSARYRFEPRGGIGAGFTLHYDVITREVAGHQAFVSEASNFHAGHVSGSFRAIGTLDQQHTSVKVDTAGGSWLHGMVSTGSLGVHHIFQGADHLLFLLTLLLPAPLLVKRGHWVPSHGGDTRSAMRVVHVTVAFAIGHSTSLALATAGWVTPPSRPIEAGIALSVAVSAIHAMRPLVPGGEAYIAGGFGLIHGFAFATVIRELRFDATATASALLGFNLGIELAQLAVVACVMPSLLAISRTRAYPFVRMAVAGFAFLAAAGWFCNRAFGTVDRLDAPTIWLTQHLFLAVLAFALVAVWSGLVFGPRRPAPSAA